MTLPAHPFALRHLGRFLRRNWWVWVLLAIALPLGYRWLDNQIGPTAALAVVVEEPPRLLAPDEQITASGFILVPGSAAATALDGGPPRYLSILLPGVPVGPIGWCPVIAVHQPDPAADAPPPGTVPADPIVARIASHAQPGAIFLVDGGRRVVVVHYRDISRHLWLRAAWHKLTDLSLPQRIATDVYTISLADGMVSRVTVPRALTPLLAMPDGRRLIAAGRPAFAHPPLGELDRSFRSTSIEDGSFVVEVDLQSGATRELGLSTSWRRRYEPISPTRFVQRDRDVARGGAYDLESRRLMGWESDALVAGGDLHPALKEFPFRFAPPREGSVVRGVQEITFRSVSDATSRVTSPTDLFRCAVKEDSRAFVAIINDVYWHAGRGVVMLRGTYNSHTDNTSCQYHLVLRPEAPGEWSLVGIHIMQGRPLGMIESPGGDVMVQLIVPYAPRAPRGTPLPSLIRTTTWGAYLDSIALPEPQRIDCLDLRRLVREYQSAEDAAGETP